jgi:ribosomal protein S27AE
MAIRAEWDIEVLPARPVCPKCRMNMISASEPDERERRFECLRCGHLETERTEHQVS